jgi:hypothetical protein
VSSEASIQRLSDPSRSNADLCLMLKDSSTSHKTEQSYPTFLVGIRFQSHNLLFAADYKRGVKILSRLLSKALYAFEIKFIRE